MQLKTWTLTLAGLALAAPAWAGPAEKTDEALTAIQNGDAATARTLLADAGQAALDSDVVVEAAVLARIEYYLGILEYYDGDREEASLSAWRRALTHDPTYEWDVNLVVDADPQNAFEAIRTEVTSKAKEASGVPEDSLGAVVYVDGAIVRDYDLVAPGRHLVQVLCPGGELKASWHVYGAAPDYLGFCPGLVPVEEEKEKGDVNVAKLALLGAGGALLVGGTAANFVWVNPKWDAVEALQNKEALQVTPSEASAAQSEFNTARWTTIGLLGGGAALVGVSFLVDAPVTIAPTTRGLVLLGDF